MAAELIIEARRVTKTHLTGAQRVEALRGVNFAVARGEMVPRFDLATRRTA